MAYFPFMIDLKNANCVIAGGGYVAYRKLVSMYEYGARITLVAPKRIDDIDQFVNSNSDRVKLICDRVKTCYVETADVVIMATDDEATNKKISEYCKKHRILVNVADEKDKCGFIFPAVHKQGEVVVAVSTGGESPVLASEIRNEIKEKIAYNYGELSKKLGEYREYILEKAAPKARKKVFSRLVAEGKKSLDNINADAIDRIIIEIENGK